MKKIFLLLFSFLSIYNLNAQREVNNWIFGNGFGLTWNETRTWNAKGFEGTPDAVLDKIPTPIYSPKLISGPNQFNIYEGNFSLSDNKGNLLFFSNGIYVWNANLEKMNNNKTQLTGNDSSAQSGIVMPSPSNPNQFYAISIADLDNENLTYSIIDMTLNKGLGGLVPGKLNIPFEGHQGILGESVMTVAHPGGKAFWVIAPGRGLFSSALNAWLVEENETGTVINPPISQTITEGVSQGNPSGYIKFTADGTKFAWATSSEEVLYIGTFDPLTGSFSNINRIINGNHNYGIEFTLTGKYMYVSSVLGKAGLSIYDVEKLWAAPTKPENALVKEMMVSVKKEPKGLGALQMGPDRRMYLTSEGTGIMNNDILIIDNPEEPLQLRSYRFPGSNGNPQYLDFFTMLNTSTAITAGPNVRLGIPTFSSSWFKNLITGDTDFCARAEKEFSLEIKREGIDGYLFSKFAYAVWNFGDGSPEITDNDYTSGLQTHSHTYPSSGTYVITVKAYDVDDILLDTKNYEVTVNSCSIKVNPHTRSK